MTAIIKALKIYLPFARGSLQSNLAYGVNFFMYVMGSFMRVFVAFYLWQAIFQSGGNQPIAGFSFTEMALYIFMAELTGRMVQNDADWIVSNEVKTGSISMNLIKPISYHSYVLSTCLGQLAFEALFVCLPIWLVISTTAFFAVGLLPPGLETILPYFLSVIFSFLIMFFFNLSFGFFAFWLQNMWGLVHVKYVVIAFLSGALFPLAFFPEWAQKILSFTPFGSITYTPLMIYLHKYTGESLAWALGLQAFWLVIFGLGSFYLYSRAVRRLTVQGG